jgi:hypothetical protein
MTLRLTLEALLVVGHVNVQLQVQTKVPLQAQTTVRGVITGTLLKNSNKKMTLYGAHWKPQIIFE